MTSASKRSISQNSDWVVPDHYISNEIHSRQRAFRKALEPHFTKRPGKPNLIPYQQRILRTIQRDDNIIIVNADKGLGPCAVTYEHQYVKDALMHLQDDKTYVQLYQRPRTPQQ